MAKSFHSIQCNTLNSEILSTNTILLPAQDYFYFVWYKTTYDFSYPSLSVLFFVSMIFWSSSLLDLFTFLFLPFLSEASKQFFVELFLYGYWAPRVARYLDTERSRTDLCHLANDPGDKTFSIQPCITILAERAYGSFLNVWSIPW